MSLDDLLIPAAVAGFVLVVCALFYMRRGNRPGVNRTVMHRMARPDATLDAISARPIVRRLTGREFLSWFYRLNLLQKLEENLWQAGIYARIADVLLVILLMFTAGLVCRPGYLGQGAHLDRDGRWRWQVCRSSISACAGSAASKRLLSNCHTRST